MPGMSGLDLLPRAARLARPDVPIIMITAYGDQDTRRKAIEGGFAASLFTKPGSTFPNCARPSTSASRRSGARHDPSRADSASDQDEIVARRREAYVRSAAALAAARATR